MVKMILLFTLLACQNIDFSSPQETDDTTQPQVAEAVTSPGKINRRLMIRSFRALNLTMSTLTNTSLQKEVSTTFGEINHMLASDNDIESFSATMQVGIFRLATSYCKKLEADSKAISTLGLAKTIDDSNKKDIAEKLINRFWQDELTIRADKDQAVSELVALADEFKKEKKEAQTFVGMCTAVLASASVTFH